MRTGKTGKETHQGAGKAASKAFIYLQRETEEKARQPETKLSAIYIIKAFICMHYLPQNIVP
jgi:hypothetical protein